MRNFFTIKKIKIHLLAFVLLLIATTSKAQFIERWSNVIPSHGSFAFTKHAVLISSDGNIVASGENKIVKYNPSGSIIWAIDVAPGLFSIGLAMAADQAGNIYAIARSFIDNKTAEGDFFIAKYNSDGKELWSRFYDGPSGLGDVGVGIGIDQFGNVYITGNTLIGPNATNSDQRIHTAKFNTDGLLQWAATFNDIASSKGNAMVVDFFTGDVYVAGFSDVPNDGDDVHEHDFTTIKYNTDGVQQWVNLYNGSFHRDDEAQAIAVDADGNVLVTGFSGETLDGHQTRVFATFKFDRISGSQIWNKKFGSGQSEGGGVFDCLANAIVVDGDDNVIVTGNTFGIDAWATIKYRKTDGKALWDKGAFDFDFRFDEALAVAVDKTNNVYVTGFTSPSSERQDIFTIKYRSSDGNEIGSARFDNGSKASGSDIAIDASGNAYVTGLSSTTMITVSYGVCAIICPKNITTNNEPGKCGAIVKFEATTTGDCGPLVFLDGASTVSSGDFFAVGAHTILVKSPSTGETCSFTLTVVDNENPIITQCAAPLTVSCAANVPLADITLIKATDNCGVVTIAHVGDVISNQTCANRFTLTRTYKVTDAHGNTATCSQVITVNDTEAPRITDFSLSKESLFPPNHSMQDITLNYQVFDNCVSSPPVKITITSNEPVNGTGDGDTDPDWIVKDDHHIQLRAERSALGNGRIYTITVTADDGCNPAVSVTKQVFAAHNITGPQTGNPFRIGSNVSLNGVFWDKPGNTHTAKWLLDGSAISNGVVVEPSGNQNGKVSGSYKFNSAGVYKMQMNVTDQSGVTSYANTNGDLEAIVVIYDPNGGNVYGGGWYNSPAGALAGKLSVTGKASYGFAVNYKNAAKPQGETQFEFKVGSFEFNAVNFDYLVVNGATAQFKGTGKIIGGQSGIGFIMSVTDGVLDGSNEDKIRMKIYNRNTGAVIYDSQPGASDAALPATAVGTNSVIVIQGNSINATVTNAKQESLSEDKAIVDSLEGQTISDGLTVNAYPNPTKNYFTISVNSNNKEEIMMQVFDQNGHTMEIRRNMIPGLVTRFGDKYRTGAYYARITQGKEHREIKLIKVTD